MNNKTIIRSVEIEERSNNTAILKIITINENGDTVLSYSNLMLMTEAQSLMKEYVRTGKLKIIDF